MFLLPTSRRHPVGLALVLTGLLGLSSSRAQEAAEVGGLVQDVPLAELIAALPSVPSLHPQVPEPGDELPLRVEGDVTHPEILHRVEPAISALAKRSGVSLCGVHLFEATIDKEGRVRDVRRLRGEPSSEFDDAYAVALKQWRFRPALKDGSPVSVYFSLTVTVCCR
jgi:TonB family protein